MAAQRNALSLREAMIYAGEMQARSPAPEHYYWSAVWWRLHAKESKNPSEIIGWSRNQLALYRDMKLRPDHYRSWRRQDGMSDWLWSGLGDRRSIRRTL